MTVLRMRYDLFMAIQADLDRTHKFAAERVGFATCRYGTGQDGEPIVLVFGYVPVPDGHYIPDRLVGARIGSPAIRLVMQRALDVECGLLHVHMHFDRGRPNLSPVDKREIPRLVQSFRNLKRNMPHGILLINEDSCAAWVWPPGHEEAMEMDEITLVGR